MTISVPPHLHLSLSIPWQVAAKQAMVNQWEERARLVRVVEEQHEQMVSRLMIRMTAASGLTIIDDTDDIDDQPHSVTWLGGGWTCRSVGL